jgi:hypothetical protein
MVLRYFKGVRCLHQRVVHSFTTISAVKRPDVKAVKWSDGSDIKMVTRAGIITPAKTLIHLSCVLVYNNLVSLIFKMFYSCKTKLEAFG